MKKFTLPKVLVLDFNKWICGFPGDFPDRQKSTGFGVTSMLNADGYMCCLGQFCEQAKVPLSKLICAYGGNNLENRGCKVTTLLNTKFEQYAISINDNQKTTIVEKVKALKKLCSKYKRKLVLKNFPEGMLDDKS